MVTPRKHAATLLAALAAALRMANDNLSAGLIFAGALGVAREYPELRKLLDDNMNGLGKVMMAGKEQLCASYQAALFPFADDIGMLTKNPFTDPVVVDVCSRPPSGSRSAADASPPCECPCRGGDPRTRAAASETI
ncbi:hypothetical protein OHA40_09490 [Nocardia sp. NBC_00508]|uniref:hypothetical protein n=1 Tax=Nocardia sp. NBC_00508 TaxID=2975992 RepID=UPI002E821BCC|nr:hypothetical protein [Nocardia sp. NBC_00508]WUD68318.1 hypothetical protein OHA40_09490 [Nocardia sp. NBC_00508]